MGIPFDDSTIMARVRRVRESYAGKRGKALFANKLGISPSTYNYYERDRVPPASILQRICEITGTDLHWLLAGKRVESQKEASLPSALVAKIETVLSRRPDAVAALDAFLDLLSERPGVEPHDEGGVEAVGAGRQGGSDWLPVLGRTAAGIIHFWPEGPGQLPDVTEMGELIREHQKRRQRRADSADIVCEAGLTGLANLPTLPHDEACLVQLNELPPDGITEFIACAPVIERFPDAFALRVDGESMAPRIRDGDIVLLSPSVPAGEAATAVVQLRDQIGVTCKIIRHAEGRVHLIAANEAFATKIVDEEEVVWALAVLYRIRL